MHRLLHACFPEAAADKAMVRYRPLPSGTSRCSLGCFRCFSADDLEGVWRFEKRIDTRPDGTPAYLAEPEFEGMLIYSDDGFMSVILMPDVYDLELTKLPTTASFFEPTVVHTGYERPGDQPHNPHPEGILDECRRLRDPFEHDVCLHYQAGIRNDERFCAEIVDAKRADKCTTWIANIRAGRINQ
jgi:hypothetical protein